MARILRVFGNVDMWILTSILVIATLLRLYHIDAPLAEWHSWRQADTAAVSRNLVEREFNLLLPLYDDLSNVQTGTYNPQGYRLVEFPIYNAASALLYIGFPGIPLEAYGRILSIAASLTIIVILYYFALKESTRIAAVAAASTFAVMPFFVYYSRVFLPDMTAVASMFASLFFLYVWSEQGNKKYVRYLSFIAACICASVGLLIKPTVIFYIIAAAAIFLRRQRVSAIMRPQGYVFVLCAMLPFILWRLWIQQYPEGIASYEWLITMVNTFEGPKTIFMRPAFFKWVFQERIMNLILGGFGYVFVVLGVLRSPRSSGYFLHAIGISALVYLLVFQGGNVQHDYYQIIILPALALYCGLGISALYEAKNVFAHPVITTGAILIVCAAAWILSYEKVKDYYVYSQDLISTAQVIQTITPSNALVVTDSQGDTTLLYNAHRRGMPAVTAPLPDLKARGMEYFVTGSGDVGERVAEEYKGSFELLFKNSHVYIFKL